MALREEIKQAVEEALGPLFKRLNDNIEALIKKKDRHNTKEAATYLGFKDCRKMLKLVKIGAIQRLRDGKEWVYQLDQLDKVKIKLLNQEIIL